MQSTAHHACAQTYSQTAYGYQVQGRAPLAPRARSGSGRMFACRACGFEFRFCVAQCITVRGPRVADTSYFV